MKHLILPVVIAHSLLIRLALIFPLFQGPIGCLLLAELAVVALLAVRSNQFDSQGQVYFGLIILGFLASVVWGF